MEVFALIPNIAGLVRFCSIYERFRNMLECCVDPCNAISRIFAALQELHLAGRARTGFRFNRSISINSAWFNILHLSL